jgi:hypothetical protein
VNMRIIQMALLISMLFGCATQKETIFIPASLLTQDEIATEKERLRNDPEWARFDVEEIIGDGKGMFTYREEDIRSAFPSLEKADKQLSLCSNSVMSNATLLVFTSPAELNRKWVKTSSCSPAEKGMVCQPLELDIKYEYQGILFDAGFDLKYEEAVKVIEFFKSHGIEGLPHFEQRFNYKQINKVESTRNGFLIGFGELFCGGCVSQVVVRPVYGNSKELEKLIFVDAIGGLCI